MNQPDACVAKGHMLEAMLQITAVRDTAREEAEVLEDEEEDFFCFERPNTLTSCAQQDLEQFLLNSSTDIQMLNVFPTIKTLFIKYNTGIPTSASVERVFSIGGIVLRAMRGKLGDETFEKQLLLKMNKQFN